MPLFLPTEEMSCELWWYFSVVLETFSCLARGSSTTAHQQIKVSKMWNCKITVELLLSTQWQLICSRSTWICGVSLVFNFLFSVQSFENFHIWLEIAVCMFSMLLSCTVWNRICFHQFLAAFHHKHNTKHVNFSQSTTTVCSSKPIYKS